MIDQSGDAATRIPPASIRLGAWSFYFLVKFLLLWRGMIGFHPLENIAFATFLIAPASSPAWHRVRTVVAIPIALGLLYYDSWLPPIERVWSQAALLSSFSPAYLLELSGRFVNWPVVAMLVLAWGTYRVTARYVRVGALVMAALLGLALSMPITGNDASSAGVADDPAASAEKTSANKANLDVMVQDFYANEAQRRITLPNADNGAAFDIIFLHICSLSWDDLQLTGLDKHPFWSNFDFLFTRFNSAASYSGPAAIRLNRALCGQTPHKNLYEPVPDNCYLLPNLKRAGFETNLAFNHDGHFDDFLAEVRKQGVSAPLMPLNGVAIPQHGFDGSPIYDDLGVLSRWIETRQKSDQARVALLYNSISLHDGNYFASKSSSKQNSLESYKPRVEKLLTDLNTFMEQVRKSGRRAIVVVVPEHGAALRGDKFQIAGLREIPTPSITTVPVGVKIIGADAVRNGASAQVSATTSYVGLSQLIANLIERPPYGESGYIPADYVTKLPVTGHVSENEGLVLVGRDDRYFLKQGSDAWREYLSAAQ
jgi:cellulose synthase operon protein YhjU